jgi:drug/metabolite transporter (DMT)-like permease
MKRQAITMEELRPGRFGRALARLARRKFLIVSVVLMAIAFFAYLNLLSIANLSFAVPITAASIVLETVLAKLVLGESVSRLRWTGVFLVAFGVVLLAI